MIELLKIMILGKWIVLTALPIQLGSTPYIITPEKSFEAVNEGAHIRIDVTSLVKHEFDIMETRDQIDAHFPPNCLKVNLITTNNKSIPLEDEGNSLNSKEVHLQFFATGGLDPSNEFKSVEISSCKVVKNVKVIWANYYM